MNKGEAEIFAVALGAALDFVRLTQRQPYYRANRPPNIVKS